MPASMAGLLMAELENSLEKLQGFPGVLNPPLIELSWKWGGLKVQPCLPPRVAPLLVPLGVLVQVASAGPLQVLLFVSVTSGQSAFYPSLTYSELLWGS